MASWTIESKPGFVLVRFECDTSISPELIMRVIRELYGKEPVPFELDLWDFRECAISPNLNYETIAAMVFQIKRKLNLERSYHKTAIVVDNAAAYGLARIYQALSPELDRETMVFESLAEAEAWIVE